MFPPFSQSEAPVERLIRNVTRYVEEHSEDAAGYYTLGRIHYLAFVHEAKSIDFYFGAEYDTTMLPGVRYPFSPVLATRWPIGELTGQELRGHLVSAIDNFRRAIAMKGNTALYHLSLACVLEAGTTRGLDIGLPPGDLVPSQVLADDFTLRAEHLIPKLGRFRLFGGSAEKELAKMLPAAMPVLMAHRIHVDPKVRRGIERLVGGYWTEQAIGSYLRAYELAIDEDLKLKELPHDGLWPHIGYEAGKSYVRLIEERGPRGERRQLARVKKSLRKLEALPEGPVTPIIFSLHRSAPLEELLEPNLTVVFDLDGTGRLQGIPWVQPTTGILVWDPGDRGMVSSGRQLIGSVTWWIFWRDGYQVLQALDDSGNGVLEGEELRGLGVWMDHNINGASEPGEVVPIDRTAVVSIRTQPDGHSGSAPMNSVGLRLRDGRLLPTYDWMVESGGALAQGR